MADVANAVYDGADAVVVGRGTAIGNNPVRVVQAVASIIREAEDNFVIY